MPVLAQIRVIPIATPTTSLSSYIALVVEVIRRRGLVYQLTPFGTCIEVRSFQELAEVLSDVSEALRSMGVNRLVIDVAIDIRFDKQITLESKVRSVEEKLRIHSDTE